MYSEFKKCHFCNETISVNASKCRYCYEWTDEKPKQNQDANATCSTGVNMNVDKIRIPTKISGSKKQLIALSIFVLCFTGGVFVFGAKAFKAVMGDTVAQACSFDNLKTRDGYIFRLMDDPDKSLADSYITKDKATCKYYIKIDKNEKVEVTADFQEKILQSLDNTSKEKQEAVELPSGERKNMNVSVDVVSDNEFILKKLIETIDGIAPQTVLNLQVYGGSANNKVSDKKLNINYTPQSLHMYKKTYERQRETIIYVTDKVLSEDKLDGDVVKSNNKNFIKKEVTDFYNQYKSDENYNQNKFLLPYLDSLKASYQKGTDYRIITDGTFNGVEANSYNFDEKRFIQHSQEIIARYKQIENARIEEAKYEKYKVVENARTEQPKYAKTIEVPSPLSQFDAYFSSKLKNKLNGLDGLCFELIQNETNKNVSWLSEKNKLFAPYICQQNESK